MTDYIFFTDSTADLSPDLIREMDAVVIPLTFTLDGQDYLNYPDDRAMSSAKFYSRLRQGSSCTTAQINTATFIDYFTPYLEQGRDILYISFYSGLSGTYQASLLAAQELKEKYPERTVECVDSLQASMGEGLVAYTAAMLRKEGQSLQEVAAWVRENAQTFCAWFTVNDLMFLKRGGRLSGTAAVAGTLLGIKPVIILKDGKVKLAGKGRGLPGAYVSLFKLIDSEGGIDPDSGMVIGYTQNPRGAEPIQQYLTGNLKLPAAPLCHVGPAIGTHTGPRCAGIAFFARES